MASGGLGGLPRAIPSRPVHGELVAVQTDPPLLQQVVDSPRVYLVPRADAVFNLARVAMFVAACATGEASRFTAIVEEYRNAPEVTRRRLYLEMIDDVLPQLLKALAAGPLAVLVAPPGAGKSTRVPLALLDASWRGDGRIIVLEPRRLAARAVARRMAATLGEEGGQTVGYRVRMESRMSTRTRIEVVTEGVFTRMLLDDPGLGLEVLRDQLEAHAVTALTPGSGVGIKGRRAGAARLEVPATDEEKRIGASGPEVAS